MAGKLKLTPEARTQILALCRAGMHPDRAFQAAGISPSSLRRYRMQANQGKRQAQAFIDELEQAIAQCEAADVMATRRAATVEHQEVTCPECGEQVKLDPLAIFAMARHVSTTQSVKASAAGIALQRLKLRFPRRWSDRVIHTIEHEHNRLLDVCQRLLERKVFELVLETYLTETAGEDEAREPEAGAGSGELH